jgi:hypothetical protein
MSTPVWYWDGNIEANNFPGGGGGSGATGPTGPAGPTGYTGPSGSAGTRTGEICYSFDGGGVPITAGKQGQVYIPTNCTITGWTIIGDVQGSAAVDILIALYTGAGAPTTGSIVGTDKPTLSNSTNATSNPLSGWGTTSIPAGTYLQFYVDSITSITHLDVSLIVTTTG